MIPHVTDILILLNAIMMKTIAKSSIRNTLVAKVLIFKSLGTPYVSTIPKAAILTMVTVISLTEIILIAMWINPISSEMGIVKKNTILRNVKMMEAIVHLFLTGGYFI